MDGAAPRLGRSAHRADCGRRHCCRGARLGRACARLGLRGAAARVADARAQAAPSLRVCALSLGAALLLALLAPAEERTDVARARAHALQATVASPLYAVRASGALELPFEGGSREVLELDCPPPGSRPGPAAISDAGGLAGASHVEWSG